jgi:hypothetical protein
MEFESWNSYSKFEHKVKHGYRYIHDSETSNFLSAIKFTLPSREKRVNVGRVFWRAQIGHDWEPIVYEGKEVGENHCPYGSTRMRPMNNGASEGRANPKGMPYLYLANNKETAMSEVRPWVDSYISVGQFKINRNLLLIDCSVHGSEKWPPIYEEEPSAIEKESSAWSYIDIAFSKPIIDSDGEADYVPTQILSDLFKSKGYDGIIYKSVFSKGFNVALYDLNIADIVSCHLFQVKTLSFTFDEVANSLWFS